MENDMEATVRIDWTEIGKARGQSETKKQRAQIRGAMEAIEWQEIPTDGASLEMGFMPGEGIKAAIRQLRLPDVSHVATSSELAPYGLLGIRTHYNNADVDVFIVDRGSDMFPVCMAVTEKKNQ